MIRLENRLHLAHSACARLHVVAHAEAAVPMSDEITNRGTDSLYACATAVTILVAPPPAETRQTAGFFVARE